MTSLRQRMVEDMQVRNLAVHTQKTYVLQNSNATEFKTNTVPSEAAISSSLAFTIGPTAAIALPPQIAVPTVIRNEEVRPTRMKFPIARPRTVAAVMPRDV